MDDYLKYWSIQYSIHMKGAYIVQMKLKSERSKLFIKGLIRDKYYFLMLIPVIAYYIIFCYAPMYGAVVAFKDYNIFAGISSSPWAGFYNFRRIFSTIDFYTVLRNTLMLNVLSLIAGFPGPIILALLLNELKYLPFKKKIQTVLYLPHFISWIVIANIFIPMLSPGTGVINLFIKSLGFQTVNFLSNETAWVFTYIILNIWKGIGWGAIIYISAISSIDKNLYEAATIDGAGKWKQCLNITLPGISSTIIVHLILRLGKLMEIGFEAPFVLGNSLVSEVSEVISTYVYRIGLLAADISRSTAIGLFQSVVNLFILFFANYLARRISDDAIY